MKNLFGIATLICSFNAFAMNCDYPHHYQIILPAGMHVDKMGSLEFNIVKTGENTFDIAPNDSSCRGGLIEFQIFDQQKNPRVTVELMDADTGVRLVDIFGSTVKFKAIDKSKEPTFSVIFE